VCASTLIALVRRYKLQAVIAFMEKAEHKNVGETVPKKNSAFGKKIQLHLEKYRTFYFYLQNYISSYLK